MRQPGLCIVKQKVRNQQWNAACVYLFADIINDYIYDTYSAKSNYSLYNILNYSHIYLHANNLS